VDVVDSERLLLRETADPEVERGAGGDVSIDCCFGTSLAVNVLLYVCEDVCIENPDLTTIRKRDCRYVNAQFLPDGSEVHGESTTSRLSMDTSSSLKKLCIAKASAWHIFAHGEAMKFEKILTAVVAVLVSLLEIV